MFRVHWIRIYDTSKPDRFNVAEMKSLNLTIFGNYGVFFL